MMPLIKKRSDYKPLQWLPEYTYLEFLIFNDFTIVKSKIMFKKNNYSAAIFSDLHINDEI